MSQPRPIRTILYLLAVTFVVGPVAGCVRASRVTRSQLADGTELYYRGDTTVKVADNFPQSRRIEINGDVYVISPAGAGPLTLTSRLLVLTVSGSASLRVTAFSSQTGEEADVVSGQVTAAKNYPSKYSEPDHLGAGDMVMVNQTIDLMEKERSEPKALQAWISAIQAAARDQ